MRLRVLLTNTAKSTSYFPPFICTAVCTASLADDVDDDDDDNDGEKEAGSVT